jgi:bacteriocin-like protein
MSDKAKKDGINNMETLNEHQLNHVTGGNGETIDLDTTSIRNEIFENVTTSILDDDISNSAKVRDKEGPLSSIKR